MTPRRDITDDRNEDDLSAYEVDGWRVGYEIEMNGVGFTGNGEGTIDDSDNDSIADGGETEVDPYAQYQALPMQSEEDNEDSSEICCNTSSLPDDGASSLSSAVSLPIRKEFEKLLQESSSSKTIPQEVIPHQPIGITLDDEKIEAIRTAMSSFTLPPPPYMKNLDDQQLSAIIREKIKTSKE